MKQCSRKFCGGQLVTEQSPWTGREETRCLQCGRSPAPQRAHEEPAKTQPRLRRVVEEDAA